MIANNHNKWRIPKHLDAPIRIVIFSMHEAAMFVGMFAMGIIMDSLFLCLFIAGIATIILRWAHNQIKATSLIALVYWFSMYKPAPHIMYSCERLWRG